MDNSPLIEEVFFITKEIEAELLKSVYVFEPPRHVSTARLYDLPGYEYLRYRGKEPEVG